MSVLKCKNPCLPSSKAWAATATAGAATALGLTFAGCADGVVVVDPPTFPLKTKNHRAATAAAKVRNKSTRRKIAKGLLVIHRRAIFSQHPTYTLGTSTIVDMLYWLKDNFKHLIYIHNKIYWIPNKPIHQKYLSIFTFITKIPTKYIVWSIILKYHYSPELIYFIIFTSTKMIKKITFGSRELNKLLDDTLMNVHSFPSETLMEIAGLSIAQVTNLILTESRSKSNISQK